MTVVIPAPFLLPEDRRWFRVRAMQPRGGLPSRSGLPEIEHRCPVSVKPIAGGETSVVEPSIRRRSGARFIYSVFRS
jgi:hypothetical protein